MTARQFFVEIKNLKEQRPHRIAEIFNELRQSNMVDRVLRRMVSLGLHVSRHSNALDAPTFDAWLDTKRSKLSSFGALYM